MGTHLFLHLFSFFRVWFSSDIDEVVATMTFWNNVSPAFFYLDDIRSGADDGQVRVSSARSESSLQIFAVGVSVRRCSWLSFVVAISTSSFDLFGDKIRFLQPSILVVKDCKSVLFGVFL